MPVSCRVPRPKPAGNPYGVPNRFYQGTNLVSQHASSESQRVTERGPLSTACAAISGLVRERWGRGPRRSRAYWAGPDMLVFLLEDAHTAAEQTLVEHGRAIEVVKGRRQLAAIAERDLRQIAEAAADRPVSAVLAQSHVSPDVTTIVFLFARGGTFDGQLSATMRQAIDETSAARALLAESSQTRRHSAEQRAVREARRAEPPPDAG